VWRATKGKVSNETRKHGKTLAESFLLKRKNAARASRTYICALRLRDFKNGRGMQRADPTSYLIALLRLEDMQHDVYVPEGRTSEDRVKTQRHNVKYQHR